MPTKNTPPTSRMVSVSPQETRRRNDGETDAQVKSRYDSEQAAYSKMKTAKARVDELRAIERGKPLSKGVAAAVALVGGANRDLEKARTEYDKYSPYAGGSPWSSTSPNNASKKPK